MAGGSNDLRTWSCRRDKPRSQPIFPPRRGMSVWSTSRRRRGYTNPLPCQTLIYVQASSDSSPETFFLASYARTCARLPWRPCSGVCSMDLMPLRPLEPAISCLLAYQLRTPGFAAQVIRLVSGQNLPRVGLKDLLSLHIPVPPRDDSRALCELAELLDEARQVARDLDERVRSLHDAAAKLLYPSLEHDNSDYVASVEKFR